MGAAFRRTAPYPHALAGIRIESRATPEGRSSGRSPLKWVRPRHAREYPAFLEYQRQRLGLSSRPRLSVGNAISTEQNTIIPALPTPW